MYVRYVQQQVAVPATNNWTHHGTHNTLHHPCHAHCSADTDYTALRDALWAAEAARERRAAHFLKDLNVREAQLARSVCELQAQAMQDVLLDGSQGGRLSGLGLHQHVSLAASAECFQSVSRWAIVIHVNPVYYGLTYTHRNKPSCSC